MPTEPVRTERLLVDTSAVRELWDQVMFQKVWRFYDKTVKHCVCGVVCFEMFRDSKTQRKGSPLDKFERWLGNQSGECLPRKPRDGEIAARLALAVQRDIDEGLKDATELKRLNNDILIAGLAISHNLTVFTEDRKDWNYLRQVVHRNIANFPNQLRVVFKSDLLAGS